MESNESDRNRPAPPVRSEDELFAEEGGSLPEAAAEPAPVEGEPAGKEVR